MANPQYATIENLQSSVGTRERYKAIEAFIHEVATSSSNDIDKAFGFLEDIFEETAPLAARCLGFEFLGQIFQRRDINLEKRAECIKILTRPVSSEIFVHKIATLELALRTNTGFENEVNLYLDYLVDCIIPQFEAKKASRERLRGELRSSSKDALPEEKGLDDLFELLTSCVRRFPHQFHQSRACKLLGNALGVAEKASQTATVERVCQLIQALIVVGIMPASVLKRCVEDLCAIYSTTQRLQNLTRECFLHLLKNEALDRSSVLNAILRSASDPPPERASYTVCGALKIIRFVITHQDDPYMPQLRPNLLLQTLSSTDLSSRSICKEILKTSLLILNTETLSDQSAEELNWRPLLQAIQTASTYLSSNAQRRRGQQ